MAGGTPALAPDSTCPLTDPSPWKLNSRFSSSVAAMVIFPSPFPASSS